MNESDHDTTDEEPRPHEETSRDYQRDVKSAAEAAYNESQADEFADPHEVVRYGVEGSPRINDYGYMLTTVLFSKQNPDNPDYGESWTQSVDFNAEDLRRSDCVEQMARACFYSDVMDEFIDMVEEAEEST